ncbi:MAG TPA: lyase family protein [Pseudonocardia sp.]|nr:lyase family protein [Pseudonocardia sp.]
MTRYGAQTELALGNFPTHGRLLSQVPELLRGYAWVKEAAARANVELGVLDEVRGAAIERAAREVADGGHNAEFPLPVVQGGGGTSTNMNVNEVLAARATELLAASGRAELRVHPNDHVNRSQSTNDTYPTAMALALAQLAGTTRASLDVLEHSLLAKGAEYDALVRLGRTCLRDAVPLTAGQTHRGQAHAVRRTSAVLARAAEDLLAVPLGGTVLGTGISAPPGFAAAAVGHLRARSGYEVTVAGDYFDAMANLDAYSGLANSCVRAAHVLAKIAADLRLLSAGAAVGRAEVVLPALQAGSSIMPGKVNPVVPELVMQLGYRIRGAASTVDAAVAGGELELNVMEPVILDALVTALTDLREASATFATRCIDGLVWDGPAVAANLAGSLHELVEMSAEVGYDAAARTATASSATR